MSRDNIVYMWLRSLMFAGIVMLMIPRYATALGTRTDTVRRDGRYLVLAHRTRFHPLHG